MRLLSIDYHCGALHAGLHRKIFCIVWAVKYTFVGHSFTHKLASEVPSPFIRQPSLSLPFPPLSTGTSVSHSHSPALLLLTMQERPGRHHHRSAVPAAEGPEGGAEAAVLGRGPAGDEHQGHYWHRRHQSAALRPGLVPTGGVPRSQPGRRTCDPPPQGLRSGDSV